MTLIDEYIPNKQQKICFLIIQKLQQNFEDVIEGNNTAILENDTDIGNPNNTLSTDVETGAETLGSDVETGAETLDQDIIILGEDSKTMLKNEIDEIEQIGKQDFDALLAKIKSLQIP